MEIKFVVSLEESKTYLLLHFKPLTGGRSWNCPLDDIFLRIDTEIYHSQTKFIEYY